MASPAGGGCGSSECARLLQSFRAWKGSGVDRCIGYGRAEKSIAHYFILC